MSSKISEPKNTKFDRFKGEPGGLVIVYEIEVYLTISMCLVYLTIQYVLQPFSNFFFFAGGRGTFSCHLQFPMVIAILTFLNTLNNFEVLLRYADSRTFQIKYYGSTVL